MSIPPCVDGHFLPLFMSMILRTHERSRLAKLSISWRCSTFTISVVVSLILACHDELNSIDCRAQKIFFFLVAQAPSFALHTFFFFPNVPPHSVPLPFSFFLYSSFPPFFLFYSPSFCFFLLFPFFLPGKFEHFRYLPGSTATTLLCFLSPD